MSQQQTSVAERNHFVDLKLQGHTLPEIADATGWSFACVRRWWRRYRDGGRSALDPDDRRKQRGGRMSSFPAKMRAAFSAIKESHPRWGAPVARARLSQEMDVDEAQLPSVSTIEKYWAENHPELLRSHRPQRPKPASEPAPDITAPHERWQLDFKEWMAVASVGYIDVLNIRDEATPVKIGSFVYPARQSTGRDIQEALRDAFSRWGLCDRLQTDRDKRLVSSHHDYPFPTTVVLWLAGLGIMHDIAPSAPDNGCVECFNGTWYDRVLAGRDFETMQEIQETSDDELDWMNHRLPSRGRDCQGRPPLEAYPDATTPRRPFSPEREFEIFSMQRVYDFLSHQFWWRRVSENGQVTLGGQRYGVGVDYRGREVRIDFDADDVRFVARTAGGKIVKRFPPKQLTATRLIGRDDKPD